MQLQFNKQMLHLQVICGILETFKPTKEIKDLYKKLERLQKKTDKFQSEVLFPAIEEIEEIVQEINKTEADRAGSPTKPESNS